MSETTAPVARARTSPAVPPLLVLALVVGAMALYPFVFGRYMNLGVSTLLLAGFALSWDILGGWTGQSSLGHAVLVGIGAYTMTLLAEAHGVPPWWGALAGMLLAATIAYLWGTLTFRLRGSYFTLSSIAVAEIFRAIAVNESWLTNGAEGKFVPNLVGPFGLDVFDRRNQYWMALAFVTLILLFLHWLRRARLGYYLRAVREDEDGAMALGISPTRAKVTAFMISAAFASLGGSLYAIYLNAFEPDNLLFLPFSIQIALLAIIGGRGTIYGPLVGAIVLGVAGEQFRSFLQEANLLV
ncbi:MAG TPA: branched-chain amino acid ABC transporter permease, partial [Deinococcales bacterium]|nr:branched-chain amino acid ABC transporter permease [Deinococcales bacterium]